MLKGFEKFICPTGRAYKPLVTISKNGTIGINRPAVEKYLDTATHAILFFRETDRAFAIVAADPEDEGAIRLRRRNSGGGADVSAKQFIRKHALRPGRCRIKESEMLICEVAE